LHKANSPMRVLSKIISILFHPIFVPTIGFLLLYSLSGYKLYFPEDVFWFSILIILQFTILIPLGFVYFLYSRQKINSIELSELKERPLPLMVNLISYSINFLVFKYLHFPDIIINFFFALVSVSAFSTLVSLKYKLSLHMFAWGSLSGIILAFALKIGLELHFLISISIIISAFVASARLWLNEHNYQQILLAWISSSIISFLVMTYL